MTEGVVSYPWIFQRTSGLDSVDGLLSRAPAGTGTSHEVYSASGTAQWVGMLMALSLHDAAWAQANSMPTRGYLGYQTQGGGPVYDSLGHVVTHLPFLYSTLFGKGLLEGGVSLDEDARDNSLVRLQRWLPTSHLVCGIESSDTASARVGRQSSRTGLYARFLS
jgi:hypothetical protein